ncbi:MAG: hypothetical protein K1X89_14775 [Myxococcaceae bacterium]|nr:hypothetical protein [Myxococcaceae bacterium]
MSFRHSLLAALVAPALVFGAAAPQPPADEKSSPVDQTTTAAPAPAPTAAAAPAAAPAAAAPAASSAPTGTTTLTAAQVALAPAGTVEVPGGFNVSVDLDHWLGVGTFIDPAQYSYLAVNLTVAPSYTFSLKGKKLRASATARATYEYTMPDNDNGRRFSPYDTRLGLSAPGLLKEPNTGITLSPSFGMTIPTSQESWQATLVTSLSLGAALAKSFGKFDFSASVGGSRGFHLSPVNASRLTTARDAQGNRIVIGRNGELDPGYFGMNTAWSMSAGGSVNFRATDSLSFYVGYTFIKSWKYQAATDPSDPNSSQALDSNGNPVVRFGLAQADRTFGVFGGSYQLTDNYAIGLSASTIQTPKSNDLSHFRFPFWSFDGVTGNSTSINLTLSAFY